ncbi:MAG: glycine cleavage system protein GcvH [Deltaproteobacteria bacterium]|nr:glycine cleavage system protein GcvH [Deltaproteobacteria bacterium]NIS76333.1 glycine cleavage system protein GcvH [Deltaproteobacteria bacterium]
MESSELKFSEDHIWVLVLENRVKLGITEYGQDQLGEAVEFVPVEVETYIDAGDTFGEIESQKAIVELISPISGMIMNVNERVLDDPSIINVDPYGRGWLVEIELSDEDEINSLMDEDGYEAFVEE